MKKGMLILATFILVATSCKNGNDVTPTTTATDVKSNLVSGSWTISSFRQKNEDKTSAFSGVTFVFNSDGTVNATKSGTITTGTWSSAAAQPSYYGAPPSAATFSLNMNGSSSFAKLNKSWDVNTATTSNDIKLDNKERLEDEHLEFVK